MREARVIAIDSQRTGSSPCKYLRPTVTERNVATIITIQIMKFFFDIDITNLLHCALCIKSEHNESFT